MTYRVEFWSSTEVASFQKALVRELALSGRAAEERYVVPQGEYWSARSRLSRWRMRFRAYGVYPLRLRRHIRRAPSRTIGVVCSNTFYAPWVAMKAAGPGVRIVNWIFDLFPDVLLSSGWLREGGRGEAVLRRLVRRSFDRAAANVFLGENLLRYAESKFGAIPRAYVIPIGADGGPFRDGEPSVPVNTAGGEVVTALYCGNMGRMHDFETLLEALPRVAQLPIRFRLLGNGPGFRAARTRSAGLPHVSIGSNLEGVEWVAAMKAAGIALVLMKEEASGLVMPSKTYSALVAGQAVVAVCPPASDLARLVLGHDAGWVVAPGDVAGLVGVFSEIAGSPEEVLRKRRNAWRAGHSKYEQGVVAGRWVALLDDVAATFP